MKLLESRKHNNEILISLLIKNYKKFNKNKLLELIYFIRNTNKLIFYYEPLKYKYKPIEKLKDLHYKNFDLVDMSMIKKCYLYSQHKNMQINKKYEIELIYNEYTITYIYQKNIKSYIDIFILIYKIGINIYRDIKNDLIYFIGKISIAIIINFENQEGEKLKSILCDNENNYFLTKLVTKEDILNSFFKQIVKFLEKYNPSYIIDIKIRIECDINYE